MQIERELTDAELLDCFEEWDLRVRTAQAWGAALSFAAEQRDGYEREIKRRGIALPKPRPEDQERGA